MAHAAEGRLGKVQSATAYWAALLGLYLSGLEQRALYQPCLAATAPAANTRRHLAKVEAIAVVLRLPYSQGHQRTILRLTPIMKGLIENVVDEAPMLIGRDRRPAFHRW